MDLFFTVSWAVLALFGVSLEIAALRRKRPEDTLSEHVWRVFRVREDKQTPLTYVGRFILAVFMVWLTGHFVFGIWGG